jgi:hypothetical protein
MSASSIARNQPAWGPANPQAQNKNQLKLVSKRPKLPGCEIHVGNIVPTGPRYYYNGEVHLSGAAAKEACSLGAALKGGTE